MQLLGSGRIKGPIPRALARHRQSATIIASGEQGMEDGMDGVAYAVKRLKAMAREASRWQDVVDPRADWRSLGTIFSMLVAAVGLAAYRRFGSGYDVREVSRFVLDARSSIPDAAEAMPVREGQALLRMSLGEMILLPQIPDAGAVGSFAVLFLALVADLDEQGLDDLLAEAAELHGSTGAPPWPAPVPRHSPQGHAAPGNPTAAGPTTINGHMLRALARRDDTAFKHWRARMNDDAHAQQTLYEMIFYAFREAVERRFTADTDVREITAFLAQPRPRLTPELTLAPLEAEALIRSALGETGLVQSIGTQQVVTLRMQLFVYLVEDLALSDEDLDRLLIDAETCLNTEHDPDQPE